MPTFPIRRLTPDDVPNLVKLTHLVDWQYNADRWRRILEWSGMSAYGITHGYTQTVLSTALGIPYERQRGWIGMVLTDPKYQRQGFGTRLMQTVIQDFQGRGIPEILLDASDVGKRLYARLGFHPLYRIRRWAGYSEDIILPDAPTVRAYKTSDLDALVALDAAAFGLARPAVISKLVESKKTGVWVDEVDGQVQGFIITEPITEKVTQLAPWIHAQADGAERLLKTALYENQNREIHINIPEPNIAAEALIQTQGFHVASHTTRMILGDVAHLSEPNESYRGVVSMATG